MSRNVQFQPLRGTQAKLLALQSGTDPDTGASVLPLQTGELYFATDTQNVFMGCPGFNGLGYIQIGDQTQVNERLDQLIVIMEGIRRVLVATALRENSGNEADYDPATISSELASVSPIGR
jgi:hypothetical protein